MEDLSRFDDDQLLAEYERNLTPDVEPLHPTGEPDATSDRYVSRLHDEIVRRGLEEECRQRGMGPPV